MKQLFKSKLSRSSVVLSAVWLIWYFGLSVAIMKNMWYTSPAIPICGSIVALLPLLFAVLNIFFIKKQSSVCVPR